MLAFHGADVVKLESRTNPDVARLFGSAWAAGMDSRSVHGHVAVPRRDVRQQAVGRTRAEAARRPARAALALIATADVFVTNYSTPAVRGLGLGPDDLTRRQPGPRVRRPARASAPTPTQPYYEFLAWGPNQAPLVGLDELTGYPDQVPAGIATIAPPDYFAGLHALAAVLTALEHRDRTGEGTVVDIAQFETTVSSLGPFLLDHALSGAVPGASGNRLAWLAPQGCYRCDGDDAWVAVTVDDDERWAAVADLLGGAARDARFATLAGRIEHHDELDALIEAWTIGTSRRPTPPRALQARRRRGVRGLRQHRRAGRPARAGAAVVPAARVEPLPRRRRVQRPPDPARRRARAVVAGRPVDGRGHPRRCSIEWAGMSSAEVDALIASGAAFTAADPDVTLRRPYVDDAAPLGLAGRRRHGGVDVSAGPWAGLRVARADRPDRRLRHPHVGRPRCRRRRRRAGRRPPPAPPPAVRAGARRARRRRCGGRSSGRASGPSWRRPGSAARAELLATADVVIADVDPADRRPGARPTTGRSSSPSARSA